MALVAISNSLRALNCTEKKHCVLSFDPLNSRSGSSGGYGSTRSVADCVLKGEVGKRAFSRRAWPPSSSSEGRKARCNVSTNASSTPESQMTDTETSERPTIQSHLDLLQQITSESSVGAAGSRKTIAQQLAADLEFENAEEVTIPLGSGKLDMKETDLTISQKRNIRRQDYMDRVSERNDAPFFTAVALFVLVPPAAILGVAVATGYIDLFP
ncbi:unnamed protein product [Calypogeia fissa]